MNYRKCPCSQVSLLIDVAGKADSWKSEVLGNDCGGARSRDILSISRIFAIVPGASSNSS